MTIALTTQLILRPGSRCGQRFTRYFFWKWLLTWLVIVFFLSPVVLWSLTLGACYTGALIRLQCSSVSAVTKTGPGSKNFKRPVLQAVLFDANYLPGVVLSVCLVKLFYRFVLALTEKEGLLTDSPKKAEARENSFSAECMLIIASMLHLAQSGILAHQVNPDHIDRMWICLKVRLDCV